MRKRGFLSHIHEESEIAEYIKNWFRGVFLGQLDIFVSSLDMEAGNWLEQIRNSLKDSSFVFPLLSKKSVDRTWVNFESGSAFMVDSVQLIPLCHKDLTPSDLTPPYSLFQAYDLRKPDSVTSLVQYLSGELDLDMPKIDAEAFCDEILRLDKILYKFFRSFEELKSSEELQEAFANVEGLIEVPISEIEIWDELELRARIHNDRIIEASGYTRDAMGFNIYNIEVPKGCNYLIVEFENTDNAISHDLDKLLKLIINRQNVKSFVRGHVHHDDSQFIVKGDGLFVFELPSIVKHVDRIDSMNFTFWRIELQGLLIRLYLA
jgi:hypothetical protein